MDELEKIQQQIQELQKKAQEIAEAKRQPELEDVKSKIKLYGFTATELGFSSLSKTTMGEKIKRTVAVKYKLGSDTWTGRGRKPKWVQEYLATGKNIEDLAI